MEAFFLLVGAAIVLSVLGNALGGGGNASSGNGMITGSSKRKPCHYCNGHKFQYSNRNKRSICSTCGGKGYI